MRCCVQNCGNDTKKTTKSHGITFHMFPKETNLRNAWIEALGITTWEPRDRSAVCSDHFQQESFYETRRGLRRIKSGSVPLPLNESEEDLDAPAMLRVCRVCLSMNVTMYHMAEKNLRQMYEQIVGMSISPNDKLPQKFCWECVARLSSASSFQNKALRCQTLLLNRLDAEKYITIRDIKSISRAANQLKSSLGQKIYEPNECDVVLIENKDVEVKIEESNEFNGVNEFNGADDNGLDGDNDNGFTNQDANVNDNDSNSEYKCPVEVKDENTNNEIFFEEYPVFDESDNVTLSEINKKDKVKKKKAVKKVKQTKGAIKVKRRKEDDDNPSSTMDKYKISDVKRRKTTDTLDESLFTIATLTYEEQIAEIQTRQNTASYKTSPFKCGACYRGFHVRDRYDAHVVRHSEQSGAYECFICKTRLKTGRALRKHLTAQHTEKFSCKGCPFVTRNRGVAREHEKWHAGAKYQCPHCPSEFDKLTTYMGHIRIKHVSDFVCELCGYTFVSKKGIDVHKKKKHRLADKNVSLDGPYCELCEVRFISEEAHSRHLNLSSRHSSDNDPNRIRNDSQSMNTEKNGRIMRKIERRPTIHPRTSLSGPEGAPVTCEQCGLQLRDLRLYAQHFRRAHPDKNRTKYPAMKTPCMCEQCGRIFQSMALLKDHMWVHTGEKRFKCDRCEKSFTQKTNLVFHMRVHSASRPSYECPLCGKHFAFYNNRRRHMFIHTGLKPFKCDTCGKCFTTSGEQRAHVEHVHLKKPWPKRARAKHCDSDAWQKCDMRHVED
ncbi:zinc finger protein 58-like [Pararge aegeria]|uniref:zinc finger protein 58-like n=1 Tax=Pararge aegeria TaxID=116150 RepID=UPI0019D0E924|nr:zinc finger protein 58-like [Pararge aegeria]